jgi:hypothetical protein
MVSSVVIIAVSAVLFAYWFRYSCILLLRKQELRQGGPDARFQFFSVQQRLQTEAELDPLLASLDRDYRILRYLLEHAAGLESESFEERLLVLDYKVMQSWYRLTRAAAPGQARRALAEMADVLGVLADRMSRQADVRNES